jgi:hypothetical protein
MAMDDYVVKLATIGTDCTIEVQGPAALLHRLLATVLEEMGNSPNGAAPAPRAAPPAPTVAKPPRRHYKRRGRPKKNEHTKPSQANVKTVPVQPAPERKCRFCANVFHSKFSGQLYCSQACKEKMHTVQPLPLPSLQATDL